MLKYFIIIIIIVYCISIFYSAIIILHKPKQKFIEKTKITDYSVIIPVKNEATNIVLCIKSILKQSFSPHKIIIVDDHSTDDILEILENNFFNNDLIQYIKLNKNLSGKMAAIKTGLIASKTHWNFITDGDCMWNKNLSENFVISANKRAISFPIVYKNYTNFFSKLLSVELLLLNSVGWASILKNKPFLISGAGMMLIKDDYIEFCDNFDLPVCHGDDMFFLEYLRKHFGPNVVQINLKPSAIIHTLPPNNLKEYLHQRARWASKTPYYKNILSWYWAILTTGVQLLIPLSCLINFNFVIFIVCLKSISEFILYTVSSNTLDLPFYPLACLVFSLFSWILFIFILLQWFIGFDWKRND